MEEKSLGAMFYNRVKKYGDRVFLKAKGKGGYKDISWNQTHRRAMGAGLGLMSMGLKAGERVSILSENRPEWAMTDLGVLSVGAVDVPIYATDTPDQCAYILKDSGARFLVVSNGQQLGKILKVRKDLDDVEKVIVMDYWDAYPYPEWVMGFHQLVEMGLKYKDESFYLEQIKPIGEDNLATLIYTSGTTGEPKGVMLSHGNFISNCRDVLSAGILSDADVALSFLPLSHSFERTVGYYIGIAGGGIIAYAESMDTLLINLAEVHPTVMAAVPRFYEKVYGTIKSNVASGPKAKQKIFNWAIGVGGQVSKKLQAKEPIPPVLNVQYKVAEKLVFNQIKEKMGGKLRFFSSGGAPLAQEIAEFFHSAGILILQGYGLSETSPVLTMSTPRDFKHGTVGKPIPSVQIRLNPGDNEILAKGPNIMKGYFNKPDKTKEVIDDDGWFHTGDVGEWDNDGFLRITDRLKDLIKTSGGKYVAPQHIEGLLIQNSFIEQVCVIGDRRKYCTALIVPNFERLTKWADEKGVKYSDRKDLISKKEVKKLLDDAVNDVNKSLPSYETLKQFTLLPEEFSQENAMLTATLKVRRKIVTKFYEKEINAMYTSDQWGE